MDAQVNSRFGRCRHLILVDTGSGDWESVPSAGLSSGGAGIQTAQMLVDRGVRAVLVGHIGPKAIKVLNNAGVQVYAGIEGTVRQSLEDWRKGRLSLLSEPNVPDHAGTGGGR